jgi:NADH:ubiquinone oxidoreductase subunit H
MRFGFFFFAEYVNVFIVSALTVTLFFGGWNAPIAWPEQWAINLALDPGSLGIGLLLLVLIAPVVLTLVFAAPLWLISSRIKTWQALLGGFVLANLFIVGLIVGGAFISLAWVAGAAVVPAQDVRARVHVRLDARYAAPASASTS